MIQQQVQPQPQNIVIQQQSFQPPQQQIIIQQQQQPVMFQQQPVMFQQQAKPVNSEQVIIIQGKQSMAYPGMPIQGTKAQEITISGLNVPYGGNRPGFAQSQMKQPMQYQQYGMYQQQNELKYREEEKRSRAKEKLTNQYVVCYIFYFSINGNICLWLCQFLYQLMISPCRIVMLFCTGSIQFCQSCCNPNNIKDAATGHQAQQMQAQCCEACGSCEKACFSLGAYIGSFLCPLWGFL